MSLFKSMTLNCPACGQQNSAQVAGSINADRRPDLRQAILRDDFQDTTCSRCGTRFRNESDLNYIDVGRQQWIAAYPARRMVDYLEAEADAAASFAQSFGNAALPALADLGASLNVRVTFGWPALREKLLARELELDDVVLECLKTELIRRLPEAPLAPGVELRLVGLEDSTMVLTWVQALTEEVLEEVRVDRALYDWIAADPQAWAAVRAELERGPFVDMQRLFMGTGAAEPAAAEAAEAAL